MPESNFLSHESQIQITVLGQEGDEKIVTINVHEHCVQLLHTGLHALYGDPARILTNTTLSSRVLSLRRCRRLLEPLVSPMEPLSPFSPRQSAVGVTNRGTRS